MGIRLIVEVLDHAPSDLSTAERLVLLVLAEDARDATRTAWPPAEVIADRAGLTVNGVAKALRRLRERGYDVRIPIGTGKDGRPVFAHRGRSTTYGLPTFPKRASVGAEWRSRARAESPTPLAALPEKALPDEETFTGERPTPIDEKGLPLGPERAAPGVAPSPQSPHIPSSSSASTNEQSPTPTADDDDMGLLRNEDAKAVVEVARRIGVSPERAQKITDEIRHRFEPRNMTAYLAKMSAEKLRELEADIGQDNGDGDGNGDDVPHYFRKPALKDCPKCDRAFRPAANYQTHCNDCMNATLRDRKSKAGPKKPEPRVIDPDAPFQPPPPRFGEENRWR